MRVTGSVPGGSSSGRTFFQGLWFYTELINVYRGDYSGGYSYRGPVPVADSFLVVTSMDAALITDGELPGRSNASIILGPQRPTNATRSRTMRQATPQSDTTGAPATADDPQQSGAFYSESWLWETVSIGKKGRKVLRLNAPDKIDQWIAYAVAVHPKFGLSWPETTVELQTVDSEE
ncbi:uncharacterized protein [Littorina saxatilis]|uniref:uncharacterized protein n=1 Tax=Littorina saxatilis TaxID=31220 RepID=UPI0038B455FE